MAVTFFCFSSIHTQTHTHTHACVHTVATTYYFKGDNWFREVGVLLGILDVFRTDHSASTLHLDEGRGHGEELEAFHVSNTPAKNLHPRKERTSNA